MFPRAQSSNRPCRDLFPNKTNLVKNFKTKSSEPIYGSHFVFCNTFLEWYKPRFLNKTEIAIQKYNQQDVIHTLPTVKTDYMSTDRTIRT